LKKRHFSSGLRRTGEEEFYEPFCFGKERERRSHATPAVKELMEKFEGLAEKTFDTATKLESDCSTCIMDVEKERTFHSNQRKGGWGSKKNYMAIELSNWGRILSLIN